MKIFGGLVTAVLCISLSTMWVCAAPVAQTASVTEKEALTIAEKQVPANSKHVRTQSDRVFFEVHFVNEEQQEFYEVRVRKASGDVVSFESDAQNQQGGKTVSLTEAQAASIVEKENTGAQILLSYLDWDDGRNTYTLSFSREDYYGEYDIDPESGKVMSRDIYVGVSPSKTAANGLITSEKALELAKEQMPGASAADIDLENYRGSLCYKIELRHNGQEYDILLDANTGALLGNSGSSSRSGDSAYIGSEKAREIILAKVPGARITECNFEWDDGRAVYEGEAESGREEYEFTLDAYTGSILEWDRDYRD